MQSSIFNSDSSGYQLTWVTDHLAVGYAPLSNEDIASMSEQGVEAIVNLCVEYCDLHEIQHMERKLRY